MERSGIYCIGCIFKYENTTSRSDINDFEKKVEELNNIFEKGDRASFETVEIGAEQLKSEVRRS